MPDGAMASADRIVGWNDVDRGMLMTLLPLGSLSVRTLVYPMSLIKTRMQTGGGGGQAYTNPLRAMSHIVRTEGVAALYKGFGVSLMGVAVGPVYIYVLETTRSAAGAWLKDARAHPGTLPAPLQAPVSWLPESASMAITSLFGGMVASALAQTMMVPIDVVSQRLMLSRQTVADAATTARETPLSVARNVLRMEGPRGLYRGYSLAIMTYVPTSSLVWASFEFVRREGTDRLRAHMADRRRAAAAADGDGDGAVAGAVAGGDDDTPLVAPWMSYLLTATSGAFAGSFAAVATNPVDVLRTRVQTHEVRISVRECMRQVVQERGWRGFYRGASARVLAMAPTSALMLTAYTFLQHVTAVDMSEGGVA